MFGASFASPAPIKQPAVFPASGNRTGIFGDSIAINDTNNDWPAYGQSWFWHAAAISNGRMLYCANFGFAGDTTALMRRRIAQVLNVVPALDVCLVMGGTNDARTAVPLNTTIDNLKFIYQTLRQSGIYVIACLCCPNSENVAYSRAISLINSWIVLYCGANGIPVFDSYSPLLNPVTGTFNATHTTDNLHPNTLGETVLGASFNAAGSPLEMFPRTANPLVQGILDQISATSAPDARNFCPNGLLQTPTANIAASWAQTGGGANLTHTNGAVTGIKGNAQSMSGSNAASQGFLGISGKIAPAAGTYGIGDRILFCCMIKVTNTTAFTWNVKVEVTGGGNSPFPAGGSTSMSFPTNANPMMLYQEFVVPPATTLLDPEFTYISGTGVLAFGQVTMINLSRLGLAS